MHFEFDVNWAKEREQKKNLNLLMLNTKSGDSGQRNIKDFMRCNFKPW